MGDTDFYGRVGELESLQDAYDSRTAEMAIIYDGDTIAFKCSFA